MVSVAKKLSTMEEGRQEESCFFWRYYKNKDHNTENLSWIPVSVKTVSVFRKLSRREEWHEETTA
jgi:hypothetical protein